MKESEHLNLIGYKVIVFLMICLPMVGCESKGQIKNMEIVSSDELTNLIVNQYDSLMKRAIAEQKLPRTIEDSKLRWINEPFDWTEGFFPGSLWYLYEITGDTKWAEGAKQLQSLIADDRFSSNHDLGFIYNCSYGNGLRLIGDTSYIKIMVDAANTLKGRLDPRVGLIKSWDADKGWQAERGWQYPVIIDNMMNLELLFEVTRLTNDSSYYKAAVAHADKTIQNHFREDHSSYHVVDYDSLNGQVRSKQTAQGFQHESSWARGQAWGLYGYMVCYRFTKDEKYLIQTQKIADYIINNAKTKDGYIPYWDYSAPNIPDEPVDVSASAITASAMLELGKIKGEGYTQYAAEILNRLMSPEYLASTGDNEGFLLKHSVGSIPHKNEIDVPLSYADYYFLEALIRLK